MAHLVMIPGITVAYASFAESREEAIRDACAFYGHRVPPAGTVAIPVEHPFNDPLPDAA